MRSSSSTLPPPPLAPSPMPHSVRPIAILLPEDHLTLPDFHKEPQTDYPLVTYWKRKDWNAVKTRKSKWGFLCHDEGESLTEGDLKNLADTAKGIWSDLWPSVTGPTGAMMKTGPTKWDAEVPQLAKAYFAKKMVHLHPFLRLCDDARWKANLYAIQSYPNWSGKSKAAEKPEGSTNLKRSNAEAGLEKENVGLKEGPSKRRVRSKPSQTHISNRILEAC